MALTVVLVRHGEARHKELGQSDFDRALTTHGAKALREAFPRTFEFVNPTEASELWVSPAVRARQTADIANETLGIGNVRELSCMYEQNQRPFLEALAATDADTVVAVGHIPFMEDVCARLCGTYLGFSTGAAAAIQMDDRGRGSLAWFVQGPEV